MRYPAYKPTGLAWLPEVPREWETVSFKSLFRFGKGLMITKDDLTKDGCSVISYGQIHAKTNSGFHLDKSLLRFVPEKLTAEGSLLHEGDIAFADTSEDIEGCGNCVLIDTQDRIYAGYHTLVAKAIKPDCSRFLAFLFQTPAWREQIYRKVNGVKVYSVTQKVFSGNKVCLPPPVEQEAIVAYLDEKTAKIDRLIELKEREIKLLNEKKQAVISKVVTRGLDPNAELVDSGDNYIGRIPINWRTNQVRHMFEVSRGRVIAASEVGSRGYPVYSSQTKNEGLMGYISTWDYSGEKLTWTTDGAYAGSVFLRKGKYNCTNVCGILSPRNSDNDIRFLFYALRYIAVFHKRYDTNGFKIMSNEMAAIKIPIPPIGEQVKIADKLDDVEKSTYKAIAAVTRQIGLLKEYRTRLISDAVTGRIDLRKL